jgi:Protein of unknown function (DUF3515)
MADRASRRAALYATLVAVPVAVLVGVIAFAYIASRTSKAAALPSASPSAVVPSRAVALPAPKLSPAHAQACLAFIAQLPTQLRNLPERHVTAGAEQNAAFGEPPVTVECGAPEVRPAATATVYPISGVCWFAATGTASTVWTTLDREVPVAVTVPNTYAPGGSGSAQWAAEFSAPLVSAMPSINTPYHC